MAFQEGPNLAEFSLIGTQAGVPVQNTFGVLRTVGWTSSELNATCTRLSVWAETVYAPVLPFDTLLQRVEAVDYTSINAPTGQHIFPSPIPGEMLNSGTANNVSFRMSRKGNARGKAARGCIYILGITKGEVVNNRISAEMATQFLDAFQVLASAGFWGTGNVHVTISKVVADQPRPLMISFPITTYYTTGLLIADMGRRIQ